ncbi:NUDIX domain-containing protein [Pseudosulfitobacter pseudonitzschiae]|uniref:NUDIX domain-containing protein n=1 Tax=Pseudosulfitobacter pseudonitzschiae TaxID=1402135 RepID=UPI001AF53426|nr:NUDIX domain-containing protein [Pseudosulfitobacter pseudonitzschiae]MBM1814724.1 NUDIX domain-containing protein [Pseudosulfitobacter pseudonitzschiae]MBM1831718.1 NUDIX domain-containing protein [Pseudosulfitobacter pseudonitzschiae]MBM1836583.1 NUDIX domain-containing protein [Pseudosulfitobacter pseudonitzschiae]MBM1841430.1 NUDIX domain-containing protein [Pseudosulfitobacter pseudonitzschiae]MBM1846297.1 NUDIX domain-containing protein [Pseudosulfitobacter pseudonitzschiae]
MTNLFFYGTLRHMPLLEIVLGTPASDLDFDDAVLPDHAIVGAEGGLYPVIIPQPGAQGRGVLVRGLNDVQIDRLTFYEGGFDFDLRPMTLADGQGALVYFADPALATDGPWSLADWQAKWGDLSVTAAREVMGYYGTRSAAEVARMFPMIRARATAQINAAQSKHRAITARGQVDIQKRERVYSKFFALDEITLRHERFSGGMSEPLLRAVFMATDAAIVLPYDPVRDRVLLVEQIRMGPLARGDRSVWHLEPIAGRIDAGETAEQAAFREAHEEADLTLTHLLPVAEAYASPGNATEFHYIYVGLADLPDSVTGVSGKEDEAEDIRSHILSFDALMQMVDDMQAANTPLLVAALWLARHRDRLRESA